MVLKSEENLPVFLTSFHTFLGKLDLLVVILLVVDGFEGRIRRYDDSQLSSSC